ncbi:hypothetical protein FB45DRAFT_1037729 [Roridomyces roridus]|uniref:Uncharacterized protein n=1 Tax=Roridomyces roridus TaxID=1738132 RepID=A0AAD7FBU1_9AGAR|nr:hypothetical protein FB45DRAFT_1037729 [Roridomyces roridus]
MVPWNADAWATNADGLFELMQSIPDLDHPPFAIQIHTQQSRDDHDSRIEVTQTRKFQTIHSLLQRILTHLVKSPHYSGVLLNVLRSFVQYSPQLFRLLVDKYKYQRVHHEDEDVFQFFRDHTPKFIFTDFGDADGAPIVWGSHGDAENVIFITNRLVHVLDPDSRPPAGLSPEEVSERRDQHELLFVATVMQELVYTATNYLWDNIVLIPYPGCPLKYESGWATEIKYFGFMLQFACDRNDLQNPDLLWKIRHVLAGATDGSLRAIRPKDIRRILWSVAKNNIFPTPREFLPSITLPEDQATLRALPTDGELLKLEELYNEGVEYSTKPIELPGDMVVILRGCSRGYP